MTTPTLPPEVARLAVEAKAHREAMELELRTTPRDEQKIDVLRQTHAAAIEAHALAQRPESAGEGAEVDEARERERFEARGWNCRLDRSPDGQYVIGVLQAAWESWLAAKRDAASQAAQPAREEVATLRVTGWPTGLEFAFEPDEDMLARLAAGSYRLSVVAVPAAAASQAARREDTERLDWLLPNLHPANFGLEFPGGYDWANDAEFRAKWRAAIDAERRIDAARTAGAQGEG